MKKIYILSIICSLLFWNCSKDNKRAKFLVQISKMDTDTVKIYLSPLDGSFSNKFKTIITKKGKFEFDTLISVPHKVILLSNKMYSKLSNGTLSPNASKMISFFIYPKSKATIEGEMKEYRTTYKATGNILNEQYSKYRELVIDELELNSRKWIDMQNNYLTNESDLEIYNHYKGLRNMEEINREYRLKNLDLEVSAYLLSEEGKEKILEGFKFLSEKVKNSDYGKVLEKRIEKWRKITTNSIAPDFEYETYRNGKFKLSKNLDKIIILDFWGSWCGPCITEMPKMKEFYKKNKDRVEIIGIAAKDKKEDWINAIQENGINWIHILNNTKIDNLVKKYGVSGYPTKIIINNNREIEGIYLGIGNEFFSKMDELLLK